MTTDIDDMLHGTEGLGERLRKARVAAGFTIAEVGAQLKIPARVLESLESEDWSRLGAPVFVHGQLRSYERLLGLSSADAPKIKTARPYIEPANLVPRTYTPPMQRIAEQLARRFVYIVITGLIAVPVWLATRPDLSLPPSNVAALDVPLRTSRVSLPPRFDKITSGPAPIVASMGSLPQQASQAAPLLVLQFEGDSWIEVISRHGTTLDKALVRKGQQRTYPIHDLKQVVLGNAHAVTVFKGGEPQALDPFLRANVARFSVDATGTLLPTTESSR